MRSPRIRECLLAILALVCGTALGQTQPSTDDDFVEYFTASRGGLHVQLLPEGAARVDFVNAGLFGITSRQPEQTIILPANPREIDRLIRMIAALIESGVAMPFHTVETGVGYPLLFRCRKSGIVHEVAMRSGSASANLVWRGLANEIEMVAGVELTYALKDRDEAEAFAEKLDWDQAFNSYYSATSQFYEWDGNRSSRYGVPSEFSGTYNVNGKIIRLNGIPSKVNIAALAKTPEDSTNLLRQIWVKDGQNAVTVQQLPENIRVIKYSAEIMKMQGAGTPDSIPDEVFNKLRALPGVPDKFLFRPKSNAGSPAK